MSIIYVPEKSAYIVRRSKRCPITGKVMTAQKITKVKSKAIGFKKAKALETQLAIELERRLSKRKIPTWEKLISDYIEECRNRGLAEITIYNTKVNIEAATISKWGELLVSEITTQQIRDLIQKDYSDSAASTKQAMLKYLRVVFTFALEQGYISRNPTPKMTFRLGDKIKKVLTEDQAKTLLNMARTLNWEWYPHVAMALYTGMRNGELYALRWDKVNIDNRQIIVDRAWCKKGGFKDTKSGDDRVVEIALPLIPLLKEMKLNMAASHFVLPHMPVWDKGEQARELRKFLMGIGLPEVRFHDLRATWATLMLSKGIPPAKVMMMGGWKDMKTMMIYMRKAGIAIKGITDCLNLHQHTNLSKVLDFEKSR